MEATTTRPLTQAAKVAIANEVMAAVAVRLEFWSEMVGEEAAAIPTHLVRAQTAVLMDRIMPKDADWCMFLPTVEEARRTLAGES